MTSLLMRISVARRGRVRHLVLSVIIMLLALLYSIGCEIYNSAAQQGPLARQTLITYSRGESDLPISAVDKVGEIKDVAGAIGIVGLKGRIGDASHRFEFVEPKAVGARFLEIQPQIKVSDAARARWKVDPRGALIGSRVKDDFHLRVGQLATLRDSKLRQDGSREWSFRVDGVYADSVGVDPYYILLHYDYIDEGRLTGRGTVSYILSVAARPDRAGAAADAIDATFINSAAPTVTQTVAEVRRQFVNNIGFLRAMLAAIAIAAIVVLIGLVLCAYVLEIRERLPHLAVLRTLGFSRRRIQASAIVDAHLTILPVGVVGLALGLPVGWLARRLEPRFLMYFVLSVQDIVTGIAILVLVSLTLGLFASWVATRHEIADALRRGMVL